MRFNIYFSVSYILEQSAASYTIRNK
jgi:hypothetical protein